MKSPIEHVLTSPDTYIGSVQVETSMMHIFDEDTQTVVSRQMEHCPGIFKIFDEAIVNCRDQVIRMLHSEIPDKKLVSFIL